MTDTPTAEIAKRLRTEPVYMTIEELKEAASRLEQLEAENKRMRKALQTIHDNHMLGLGNMVNGHACLDDIAEIARAALSSTRGET